MAAVLACGEHALLSHRSAAGLWDLAPSSSSLIDVTAPRSRRRVPRLALHRVRGVDACDRAELDGIPITSVARTLFDLAEVVNLRRLERAFEQAERLRLLDLAAVSRLCEDSPGRRALRPLATLLPQLRSAVPETRSELERRFLDLCRAAGLPEPAVNVVVEGFEVDVLWANERLVVELDGYAYHRTRAAFERDRSRDATLQIAGYRVLRVTHRMLETDPGAVIDTIRSLLDPGQSPAHPGRRRYV